MADEFDVEAMLEAPFKQDGDVGRDDRSSDRDRDRNKRKKDRKRSRSRDRGRSDRDRGDRRDRDRDRDRRDRDRDRDRGRRGGSRERDRERRRSREREPRKERGPRSRSRERRLERKIESDNLEDKDARTVFCMQLSARLRPRDLEQFFSSVGRVKDCRIITDNKTRRSKGIAYVEFQGQESVPLAMGLSGQKLLGVPIIVQHSQAEKNRQAQQQTLIPQASKAGPMRLYVGSLHFNITEEMLRGIFEPFGKIDEIKLMKNQETNRSQCYGFVTFNSSEEARKALDQLNGFELAGRPMKVGHVTERTMSEHQQSVFDSDEMDRAGIDLGATGRLQLMAKLAEGTGFQIPNAAASALSGAEAQAIQQQQAQQAPPIATQCFMLSNMFDPGNEAQNPLWETEVRDDVIDECNKHGGVYHIYVDKASNGNVYVKCPSIAAAVASVNVLHGRYFGGRVITAAYVPLPNYHQLFPDAQRAVQLLMPSQKNLANLGIPAGAIPGLPPFVR